LTAPQASVPAPVQTPAADPVNREKLDALTRAKEATPAAPAPAPEEKTAAELDKANEKLSSLLGKPK
jgi:hypothetical protein